MFRLVCLVIGYGLGCIQTAYIVGKAFGKLDIREYGSGNAGMTNVTRVMGARAGLSVFCMDMLKAVVAYVVCSLLFHGVGAFWQGDPAVGVLPGLYAGIGVILGHNFPFYLGFRGGKGIAASIGLTLCLDWRVALVDFVCGFVAVLPRYISVSSLVMTALLPILMLVFGHTVEEVLLCCVVTALAYYQHRGNIVRLVQGKERKFSFHKDEAEGKREGGK